MRNILLICLFLLLAWGNSLAAPVAWNVKPAKSFFKGNGSSGDPYVISTVEEFALMAAYSTDSTKRGRSYILETDIVINEGNAANWGTKPPKYKWISLGDSSREASVYLDGNGHTISGLYVNSEEDYQGLFGKLNGDVRNLNVVNSFIKGGDYVGAIAGHAYGFIGVYNVFADAIVEGYDFVGGIVGRPYGDGFADGGGVSYAVFKGSVKGHSYVGGIFSVGNAFYSESASSSYCDNYGSVVGTGEYVGGIFGLFMIDVAHAGLYKLRNFGAVSGNKYVGGIGGQLYLDRDPDSYSFNFSYLRNMGEIFGGSYVGGLFGNYYTGRSRSGHAIKNSYNAGRVKGNNYVHPLFTHDNWQGYDNYSISQNSYSFAETYKGDLVLVDERKTMEELNDYADSLGAYYIPDTGATKLNNGYPILIEENKNFKYLEGSGTSSDPYLIGSMNDLAIFGKHARAIANNHYKQTADIVYDTSRNWVPLELDGLYYDGDGHKITNLKSVWPKNRAGFIDSVIAPITVKNLELANVHIDGHYGAGALAAYAENVNLSNIKVSGTVVARRMDGFYSSYGYAGGVIGRVSKGVIDGAVNYADVTSPEYAGGIYGKGYINVFHSTNYGNIKSQDRAGGITGTGGDMLFVKNYGNIQGSNDAGGISVAASVVGGFNRGEVRGVVVGGVVAYPSTLSYVYNTGNVITDSLDVGGMILSGVASNERFVNHAYYEKKGNLGLSGSNNTSNITFTDTASFTQKQFKEKDIIKKMGIFFAYDEKGENDGYPVFYEGFKGEGTPESPYLISSKEELLRLSSFMNNPAMNFYYNTKNYRLTKDIVFESSDSWEAIGNYLIRFEGEFDGDNHVVAGLNMDVTDKTNKKASLFGFVAGTIKNLGVENSTFVGDTASAIVAVLEGGVVKNCWNRNSEVNGKKIAGGVVAKAEDGYVIDRVFNTGTVRTVDGGTDVGGIVGRAMSTWRYRDTISNSFNVGKVQVNDLSNGSLSSLIGYYSAPDSLTLKKVYTISTVKAKDSRDYCKEFGVNVFYLQVDSLDTNGFTQEFMKSKEFVELLGPEFVYDSAKVNNGYPILANSKALFKKTPGANDEPKIAKNIPLYNVAASHGSIAISGLAGNEKVAVVKVNGKAAWIGRATGAELMVHVDSPGIYFVKVKSMVAKVLVR